MSYSVGTLAVLLVAFLVLTGCDVTGNGGLTTQSDDGPVVPGSLGGQDGVSVEVVGESADSVAGETASVLAIRVESVDSFVPDPAAERSGYSDAYLAEMYEGLMRFGPDGVELGLADGFAVSSSGTEYEFTLRPGLKFNDGEGVTAGDFKWSWERALSPRLAEGSGREVLGWIEGAEAVMAGEVGELSGVVVVDDRTLRVRLVGVLPNFPELLASPAAAVLHRPNVESWGFDWSRWRNPEPSHIRPWYFDVLPVGTGPFALTEFDFWSERAVFSRNEHYWDEPSGLDRIEFLGLDEPLESREPDLMLNARAVDVVNELGLSVRLADVGGSNGPVVVGFSVPRVLELLVLDPGADGTSDVHVRRVLAAAVSESGSADVSVWTESGPFGSVRWYESVGVLPPGQTDDGFGGAVSGDGIAAALAEFEVAGNRSFGPVVLEYFDATRGPDETLGWRVGRWFRDLGVELLPVYTLDSATWFPPAGRSVAVRRVRIVPASDDPYHYFSGISNVLGADSDAPEVVRFRELLGRAVSEVDGVERLRLYREVERYLVESAIVIPLYVSAGRTRILAQPWLRGLERSLGPGSRFKDVWIDVDHPGYVPLD